MYVKADFTYDAGRDVYLCPVGEDLIYRYTTEERGVHLRRYWVNACQTCPPKANAPPARNGGLPGGSTNIWLTRWAAGWAVIPMP